MASPTWLAAVALSPGTVLKVHSPPDGRAAAARLWTVIAVEATTSGAWAARLLGPAAEVAVQHWVYGVAIRPGWDR